MRILIPYDGTKNAKNALFELQNASIGQNDEILVVLTEIFLTESAEDFFKAAEERRLNLEQSGTCSYAPARRRLEEERLLARELGSRLLSDFPSLNIQIETLPNLSLVSSEILEKAARWKADLIILGTDEGASAKNKNSYKSGLRRVAAEALCATLIVCGATGAKSAVKSDRVFVEGLESLNGKQIFEQRKTSNNITGTLVQRQGSCSVRKRKTMGNREQIMKILTRRPIKSPSEIKAVAHRATVSG